MHNIKRSDYKLMFQIRVYIGFYQKTTWFLLWAKEIPMALYVNVKMVCQYIITGPDPDRIS
jgi:hypothetical protein